MNNRIFNRWQKSCISFWCVLVPVVGGWLSHVGCVSFDHLADTLLEISIPLLGLVLVTVSVISPVLDKPLIKRLNRTNAFYSLNRNLYFLMVLLFIGSVAGAVLRHVNYASIAFVINLLILVLIASIFTFFWYAFTRFLRMMRNINHSENIAKAATSVADDHSEKQ